MRRVIHMRCLLLQYILQSQLTHFLVYVTERLYYCSLQKLVRIILVTTCDRRPGPQGIMAIIQLFLAVMDIKVVISSTKVLLVLLRPKYVTSCI